MKIDTNPVVNGTGVCKMYLKGLNLIDGLRLFTYAIQGFMVLRMLWAAALVMDANHQEDGGLEDSGRLRKAARSHAVEAVWGSLVAIGSLLALTIVT